MISKMVFESRLDFVSEALPNFTPHICVSSSFRGKRADMPAQGSPDDGDREELVRTPGDRPQIFLLTMLPQREGLQEVRLLSR